MNTNESGETRDDGLPVTDPVQPSGSQWFYSQRGEMFGPVSSMELRAAACLGFLGPEDMVRRSDKTKWVIASSVQGLFKTKN